MIDTGNAILNQLPQSSWGSMNPIAIRFRGKEIGELWSPMLAANAIPTCVYATFVSDFPVCVCGRLTMKHGAKEALAGSVRRIGCPGN